jgi:hypothetical protein
MRRLRTLIARHLRLTSWVILAIGMGGLVVWAAQDRGLTTMQLAGLVAACIALAGACAWVIGWE